MIEALKRRVMGMVNRAIIEAADDSDALQMLQLSVLDGELHDGVERFADYGFTSHPFPEAEAVVVFAQGLRSHGLVIAVGDRRYRLTGLAQGEVAMHDDQGQMIVLKRAGIRIESPFKVEVAAPQVTVTADHVDLGGSGGQPVARVGDSVSGGVITSGSSKVKAS